MHLRKTPLDLVSEKFVIIKKLGSGCAGTVFCCIPRYAADSIIAELTQRPLTPESRNTAISRLRSHLEAVKVVSRDESDPCSPYFIADNTAFLTTLNREIDTLRDLNDYRNPNIVHILDAHNHPVAQTWYSMPLAKGGSVADLTLHFERGGLPASLMYHIVSQLAKALLFLHHGPQSTKRRWHSIIHGDPQLGNLLLEPARKGSGKFYRGYPSLVLADFGMCRRLLCCSADDFAHAVDEQNYDVVQACQYLEDVTNLVQDDDLYRTLVQLGSYGKDPKNRLESFIKYADTKRDLLYQPLSDEAAAYLNREVVTTHELVTVFPAL